MGTDYIANSIEGTTIFSVKDNHAILKADINDFVQDEKLQKTMDIAQKVELQSP